MWFFSRAAPAFELLSLSQFCNLSLKIVILAEFMDLELKNPFSFPELLNSELKILISGENLEF